MEALTVKVENRTSNKGHPFSVVLYSWVEDGEQRYACTHLWHLVDSVEYERLAFLERRRRGYD